MKYSYFYSSMQVVQFLATVAFVGHTKEELRHSSDSEYTPMWKQGVKQTLDTCTCTCKCQYPDCVATSENTKVITPSEEYQLSIL